MIYNPTATNSTRNDQNGGIETSSVKKGLDNIFSTGRKTEIERGDYHTKQNSMIPLKPNHLRNATKGFMTVKDSLMESDT
jgi:hypothetical protein